MLQQCAILIAGNDPTRQSKADSIHYARPLKLGSRADTLGGVHRTIIIARATFCAIASVIRCSTDEVYQSMIDGERLDVRKSASALNLAVRRLRDKLDGESVSVWAPYIHIGV
jgi:hypothetical protein